MRYRHADDGVDWQQQHFDPSWPDGDTARLCQQVRAAWRRGSTRQGERPGRSLSTGLLGWMENLKVDHAEGQSIAALALRHKLPADYIEAVLLRPTEEVAVKPAVFSCPATWPTTTRRTTGRPWQRPAKRAFLQGPAAPAADRPAVDRTRLVARHPGRHRARRCARHPDRDGHRLERPGGACPRIWPSARLAYHWRDRTTQP